MFAFFWCGNNFGEFKRGNFKSQFKNCISISVRTNSIRISTDDSLSDFIENHKFFAIQSKQEPPINLLGEIDELWR